MIRRARYAIFVFGLLHACAGRPSDFGETPDASRDASQTTLADVGDTGPRLAQLGELCDGPTACAGDALCIGASDGEFRCMARCADDYSLCDGGAVCLPIMTEDGAICYTGGVAPDTATCANNLECAPGLLCFGSGAEHYCRAACAVPDDCATDETCLTLDSGAGLCRSAMGAACATDADCRFGLVCSYTAPTLANAFPGGYCTALCEDDADCLTNSVCRMIPGTATSACVQRCSHVSDCRFNASYTCLGDDACDASTDPTACRTLFGADALCVPGPF